MKKILPGKIFVIVAWKNEKRKKKAKMIPRK